MDRSTRELLTERWKQTLDAVERFGGETEPLIIEPPASLEEVIKLEDHIGVSLPEGIRDMLLTFSRKVSFYWSLPEGIGRFDEFPNIFCGDFQWSIEFLETFNNYKGKWINEVFSDPTNTYDAVWHKKFAFLSVGNGDYLTVDTAPDRIPTVVYLSHDGGQGHGRHLGADFTDFILRWSRLGCVGAEDWQWMSFAPSGGYLDPDCTAAKLFRCRLDLNM